MFIFESGSTGLKSKVFNHTDKFGPFTQICYSSDNPGKAIKKQLNALRTHPLLLGIEFSDEAVQGPGGVIFIRAHIGKTNILINIRGEINDNAEYPLIVGTGTCLFSANAAKLVHPDGSETKFCLQSSVVEKPGELKVSKRLTLYEIETITRICNLLLETDSNVPKGTKLIIHIPQFEYYTYLFDAYSKGLVSKEMLNEWIKQVDSKVKVIKAYYTSKLRDLKSFAIEFYNPFVKAEDAVKSSGSLYLSADEILYNDLWDGSGIISPSDISGLKRLTEVGYALPFIKQKFASPDSRIISVDDYSEFRILNEAAKYGVNISGILTCPMLHSDGLTSKDLYQWEGDVRVPDLVKLVNGIYCES